MSRTVRLELERMKHGHSKPKAVFENDNETDY